MLERVFDSFMALPFITFAVAVGALLGNTIHAAMIAVGILAAPTFFRVVRAAVLETAHTQFVEAARLLGVPLPRIIATHVLPRIVPVLLVTSASALAASLLVVASLTFLGVGVQPPTPTWGGMLSADLSYLAAAARRIQWARRWRSWSRWRRWACWPTGSATWAPGPMAAPPGGEGRFAGPRDGTHRRGGPRRRRADSGGAPRQPVRMGTPWSRSRTCRIERRLRAHPWCAAWSLRVPRGASVGILGESGSGKTMTVEFAARSPAGRGLRHRREHRASTAASSLRRCEFRQDLHGRRIGTVFQDPATWFTPHLTVGAQVDEVLRYTLGLYQDARCQPTRAELLAHVGLRDVGPGGPPVPPSNSPAGCCSGSCWRSR